MKDKAEIQIKLINWIANEATEEQLEGLEDLLFNCDIVYGLERIIGRAEYQDFIKDIREDK